jgi:LPS sulfotransferase NodH
MPVTILLCHERSGSHLLGEFLGNLDGIGVFDEVCNARSVQPRQAPESFHRFRYAAIVADPDLLLDPTRERHLDFIRAYFTHLATLDPCRNVVVDIKYGHVVNFEGWWWPITPLPRLIALCEADDIGIIHLVRENTVEAVASGQIANQRQLWHAWEKGADEHASRTYRLAIPELVRRVQDLETEKTWFRKWLANARRLDLTYERMSHELGSRGELDDSIASFVGGVQTRPFVPRNKKVTRPLREIVENYAELKSACEAAGLGHHLR